MWNHSSLSVCIKTFLKPFIQNIEPENAIEALEELPQNAKEILYTKGIINLMPS
jgi:hypothetical protein